MEKDENSEEVEISVPIKKDPAKYRKYALIIASVSALIMLFGIIFLGHEFREINKDGLSCLNSPLGWAEYRMDQTHPGEAYDCSCKNKNDPYYYSLPQNWSIQKS